MQMKPILTLSLLAGVVTFSDATLAWANSSGALIRSAPRSSDRNHEVRLDVGSLVLIYLPLPTVGVTYAFAPNAPFKLEVGAGTILLGVYGVDERNGYYASLVPKLALGSSKHRFTAGVGAILFFTDDDASTQARVEPLGYEYRSDGGLVFALNAGLVTAGDLVLPSLQLGFGFRF
jgi:hypothetical protein